MHIKSFIFLALCAAAALAHAQTWPTAKPIHLVVAYPPGGVSDSVARALAQQLAAQLATPVIVDNKAGASGSIGMDAVARAAPDGYTLGFASTSPLTLNPHVGHTTFDPLKDVTPVARVMVSPVLLLATSATDAKGLPELLAAARAKPGAIRWATSGMASLGHIMLAQLSTAAKAEFTHVPYKGGGQQITDALGGQYEVLSVNVDSAMLQFIKAGKLRPLAVGAPARLAALPQVPTLAELGFEAANMMSVFGVFAPAGVPAGTLQRLNAETNRALATPALHDRLVASDNVPASESQTEFVRQIAADYNSNGRLIHATGIKAE